MTMQNHLERPDLKFLMLEGTLPNAVRGLSNSSNRPVVNQKFLFFREGVLVFRVPEITKRGPDHSWEVFSIDPLRFYLWQADGSLAVYEYFAGVGCLSVGFISSNDWSLRE